MDVLKEYVANIEETCGEERHFIIMLKYEKREEAIEKILKKGEVKKSFCGLVFEVSLKNIAMRLYKTGKMLLKNLKSKEEVEKILKELLQ